MGSYYKQIAARFRRQAAEAQREKSVVDGKISRLRKASSSLASEIQSIDNRARTLGQILPLDSSSFKGSRQQDFEGHFYNLGTNITNFRDSHNNNKTAIEDKIRSLETQSSELQSAIASYYRQARVYEYMED